MVYWRLACCPQIIVQGRPFRFLDKFIRSILISFMLVLFSKRPQQVNSSSERTYTNALHIYNVNHDS